MKTTYILIIVVAVFTILFHFAASASEREPDHQRNRSTINNVVHKHENQGMHVLLGMLLACRLNAARAALIEGRWWTWCGEPKPSPDLPKPGPVLNDVTPSTYIIEAK